MAWSFLQEDVKNLLNEKVVVIIGDSNMRGMYKDIVCLLKEGRTVRGGELKKKGELEFLGDKLLEGGTLDKVIKSGINYTEVRRLDTGNTVLRFYFVTRCYSDYMQKILDELKKFQPDVIVMNSCVWDLHRYGPHGLSAFKQNLQKLLGTVTDSMGPDSVFIWTAALPVAKKCKGGFLLPYCDTIPSREVVEANYYSHELIERHNHTFLDLHMVFSAQLHHRAADGIHWNSVAHRRISNLLLSQISELWAFPLPRNLLSWHPPLIEHMYPESSKLTYLYGEGTGAHLETIVQCQQSTSRNSVDSTNALSSASDSSSDEMNEEKVYKRRFGRFAHLTSAYTLPMDSNHPIGSTLNKNAAEKVGTAPSNGVVKDQSLLSVMRAPAPILTQCQDRVHVNETSGCDSSECGSDESGNGKKRKTQDVHVEKAVVGTEHKEHQAKRVKFEIPSIYSLKPIKAPTVTSNLEQVHLTRPKAGLLTGQAYSPVQFPGLGIPPTGQVGLSNQLQVPVLSNMAHALSKVPSHAATKTAIGQAYWPKTSNNMLAHSRFHPYASRQTLQWLTAAPQMNVYTSQRARHLAYRPAVPTRNIHSYAPSGDSSRKTSEPQVPYQEVLKMMQKQMYSRYQ